MALFEISKDWKGFLVSERTADPDRAVQMIKNIFPYSYYSDSSAVTENEIRQAGKKDFILISTHGSTSGLYLDQFTILPKHLSPIKASIAYLDSCTLGISAEFINAFAQAGTRYYLGPILSNEDGNSSTITIQEFFKHLQNGETPENALFLTRCLLYDHFSKQGDDFKTLMFRAFTFRLYALNP